jgi:hypothetical protein
MPESQSAIPDPALVARTGLPVHHGRKISLLSAVVELLCCFASAERADFLGGIFMTAKWPALAVICGVIVASSAAAQPAAQAKVDIRASATAKFKSIDKNGDGFLDAAEIAAASGEHFETLGRVMPGAKSTPADQRAMRRRIMAADRNRDGKVSLDEYIAWSVAGTRQKGRAR